MAQILGILLLLYLLYLLWVYIILPILLFIGAVLQVIFIAIVSSGAILSGAMVVILAFVTIYALFFTFYSSIVNAISTIRAAHQTNNARPDPKMDFVKGTLTPPTHETHLVIYPFRWLYKIQPARPIYAFDAGWFVMRETALRIWEPTIDDRREWWGLAISMFSVNYPWYVRGLPIAAGVGFMTGWILSYPFALLFTLLFLVTYFFAMLGLMLPTVSMIAVVSMGTTLYSAYNKVRYICPNCSKGMRIPKYVCPSCKMTHDRLWPSVYGVWQHTCQCGCKLPSMPFSARRNILDRHCVHCDYLLTKSDSTTRHIIVVGGTSSGKSVLSTIMMKQFIDYMKRANLSVELPSQEDKTAFDAEVSALPYNIPKTSNAGEFVKAKIFKLSQFKSRIPISLYLHDIAGEHISTQERSMEQIFFRLPDVGIILVIDPFSIPDVKKSISEQIQQQLISQYVAEEKDVSISVLEGRVRKNVNDYLNKKIRLSPTPPEDIASNLIIGIQSLLNESAVKQMNLPVAVVVTKTDVGKMEKYIGAPLIRELRQKRSSEFETDMAAMNYIVRDFLMKQSPGLVKMLETRFTVVHYFSVATILHRGETSGVRTLQPLVWLLDQQRAIPKPIPMSADSIPSQTDEYTIN